MIHIIIGGVVYVLVGLAVVHYIRKPNEPISAPSFVNLVGRVLVLVLWPVYGFFAILFGE